MKKLVTFISFIIIIAFVAVAVISLIPEKSRDGLPIPSTSEAPPETSGSTPPPTTTSPIIPPTTVDTSLLPPVTDETPAVTPTPEVKYPVLTLSSTANSENVLIDGIKIATMTFSIPLVAYPEHPEIAEKINASLNAKSLDHIENFKAECEFLAMDFFPDEMDPYSYYSSSRLCIGKNTVSIKMTCEIDYGSAQPEKQVFCYNFSLDDGKEIDLPDLRIDNTVLIDAVIESSRTMTNVEFSSNYQDFIKAHICNSWYLDKNILYLVYVPFEIASGNFGIVEIPVDLDTLNDPA